MSVPCQPSWPVSRLTSHTVTGSSSSPSGPSVSGASLASCSSTGVRVPPGRRLGEPSPGGSTASPAIIGGVFVDRVSLMVRAGDGGAGSAHLASEPYKPRGGAEGGDGGAGGDVVLRVDASVFDLSPYLERRAPGRRGRWRRGPEPAPRSRGRRPRPGVPDGTVVHDERGLVADLVGEGVLGGRRPGGPRGPGERHARLAPGTGSRGWPSPASRARSADRAWSFGWWPTLGLVGLPNAGKSTLLAALTAARPKIADYPFTTLAPNLGVAEVDGHRFVVADVPGLIQGAHQGRGLGLTFLRHVSRCRVLLFVVDLTGEPAADLATVRAEVRALRPRARSTADRWWWAPRSTSSSRTREPPAELRRGRVGGHRPGDREPWRARLAGARRGGAGVRARPGPPTSCSVRRESPSRDPAEAEGFRVSGSRVERWVAETDMDDEVQVEALQRRLISAGVERRLAEAGARRGDEVAIGRATFEFDPEGGGRPEASRGEDDRSQA